MPAGIIVGRKKRLVFGIHNIHNKKDAIVLDSVFYSIRIYFDSLYNFFQMVVTYFYKNIYNLKQ